MRRLFILITLLFAPFVSMSSQVMVSNPPVPKDSLPDLWIIMIDMSGSMKSGRNLTVIPEKVHTIVTEHCKNLDNARFVLLGTGMMMSAPTTR